MQHQQKEDRKPIGKLLQERKGIADFADTRIRMSKDFTFYGITQTKSGDAEISLALKIIMASGEQLIVQYHELISPIRFNGVDEIKISTTTLSVIIKGKNLEKIIDYLAEHRLVWIKEPDSDFMKVKEGEVEVLGIEVKEK